MQIANIISVILFWPFFYLKKAFEERRDTNDAFGIGFALLAMFYSLLQILWSVCIILLSYFIAFSLIVLGL